MVTLVGSTISIVSSLLHVYGSPDLPELARRGWRNNVSDIPLDVGLPMHVDIPRLREGKVGGLFWYAFLTYFALALTQAGCRSAFVPCADSSVEGKDFLTSTWRVRYVFSAALFPELSSITPPSDTLEQIDVAKGLIEKYPDVRLFSTHLSEWDSQCLRLSAMRSARRISSNPSFKERSPAYLAWRGWFVSILLSRFADTIHRGHQLGNSISVLRQYFALGVRYLTLTHTCHNAFADSCGNLIQIPPRHYGLRCDKTSRPQYFRLSDPSLSSTIGFKLIEEMNRIGMLVDLSHTSDLTATQAILHSKAPVIWSHSSARAVHNVARNVPDEVLTLIGTTEGKNDGIIMVCSARSSYRSVILTS